MYRCPRRCKGFIPPAPVLARRKHGSGSRTHGKRGDVPEVHLPPLPEERRGRGGREGRYHDEACEREHVRSEDTAQRLRKLAKQPETCPDCYDLEKLHCSY